MRPIRQPAKQHLTKQSNTSRDSTGQSEYQPTKQSENQQGSQKTNQPTNQPTNQSEIQQGSQKTNQPNKRQTGNKITIAQNR